MYMYKLSMGGVVELQHTCRCSSTSYKMSSTSFVQQQLYCRSDW